MACKECLPWPRCVQTFLFVFCWRPLAAGSQQLTCTDLRGLCSLLLERTRAERLLCHPPAVRTIIYHINQLALAGQQRADKERTTPATLLTGLLGVSGAHQCGSLCFLPRGGTVSWVSIALNIPLQAGGNVECENVCYKFVMKLYMILFVSISVVTVKMSY